MVAKIRTVTFEGVDVRPIEVQVLIAPGMPAFSVVGLPDKAVEEARERVRASVHALGLSLPAKRITINLAPADITKEGSHFDLPIAIGLLVAMGVLPQEELEGFVALGELSLDARVQSVSGVLPAAIHAASIDKGLICPAVCGGEAAWSGLEPVLAPASLLALINHFKGIQVLRQPTSEAVEGELGQHTDMREVRGQAFARRALEVAASGAHNLLMSGPPGAGKSMLASCLPGILPPLDAREVLESSMIASVAGKLTDGKLTRLRPFRDPHHSSSMAAMVGGGKRALPGEISLAHNGVLFLDEMPEFPRGVLESLRQPLETGAVSIARAAAHVTYPARFQLIAAMNPCRCGFLNDPGRACNKAPRCGQDYAGRLSGPLLDRIDLTIDVPEVPTLEMLSLPKGEDSATVGARVSSARKRQRERYASWKRPIHTNAELSGEDLTRAASLDEAGHALLAEATEKFRLSMRGYTRVLRVARTLADMDASDDVKRAHVAEAVSYRQIQAAQN